MNTDIHAYFKKKDEAIRDIILVFIKERFVRDAQALINFNFKSDTLIEKQGIEDDSVWKNVGGDLLVAYLNNISLEDAKARIRRVYKNADESIFSYLMFKDGEMSRFDYCDELCPECDNEVIIASDRPSICPKCGNVILPCSMCDMEKVSCSVDCPFKNQTKIKKEK